MAIGETGLRTVTSALTAEPSRAARRLVGWIDDRRSLSALVRGLREVLPGDPRFGDPLSTTGTDAAQRLAKRAWSVSDGRLSTLAEVGLAALQVADWLGADGRGLRGERTLALLFTDLVGYSSWALRVGDADGLDLLREADRETSRAVTAADGVIVKRLGDGVMAVFPDAGSALAAAADAVAAVARLPADGYEPRLRAGLHCGTPQPIGTDFIGIDVNIAARLCEAAQPNEILMTEPLAHRADDPRARQARAQARRLPGVPHDLILYSLPVDTARPVRHREEGRRHSGRARGGCRAHDRPRRS